MELRYYPEQMLPHEMCQYCSILL